MQTELNVKLKANNQVKLYSRCCLVIKTRVFYSPSVLQSHRNWGCRMELELRPLAAVLWDKGGGKAEPEWGNKILWWNLSKANNHSGAGEEYYIRVQNQYHITLSIEVHTRLIKLIIFDATMAVSFTLNSNYCSITEAESELGRNQKRNYSKKNGYLFD